MNRTLPRLFEESVNKYPNNIMMWENKNSGYESTTYRQMHKLIYNFAAGLIKVGFNINDRAALISEGRNYWVMSELGILYAGGINVPISVKIDELSDLKFRLAHSGCRFAIVSETQLHKIRKIKIDLPDLEKTILLDSSDKLDVDELPVDQILELGEDYLKNHKEDFEKRWQGIKENDYANICYTSGTTADPKGIILTHRNYTSNVEQASRILDIPERYV